MGASPTNGSNFLNMDIYDKIYWEIAKFQKNNFLKHPDVITLGRQEYYDFITHPKSISFNYNFKDNQLFLNGMKINQSRKNKYLRVYKKGFPQKRKTNIKFKCEFIKEKYFDDFLKP